MRHLRKLKLSGRLGLTSSSERFRAGYTFCAGEISRLVTAPSSGLDMAVSARLLHHLSVCIRNLETLQPPPSLLETLQPPSSLLETLQPPSSLLETLQPPSSLLPLPQQSPPPPLLSPSEVPGRSDVINQSKIEALRFSLGHGQSGDLPPLLPSDREDDKAWRPW